MASASITCHYVVVDGRTVHFRHLGRGEPVVLLHAAPRSSRAMSSLMRAIPAGFSAFAIDLPGFGRSDPLPGSDLAIDAFADALAATLTTMGLGRVHLYGTHTGAGVGVAFAVRHPARVGAVMFDGLSAFDADECAGLDAYLPPFVPNVDGTHMTWLWNRLRDQALFFPWNDRSNAARLDRPVPATESLQAAVVDFLMAADYRQTYAASFATDARMWVERLTVPTRIGSRPDDVLASHLGRLGTPPPCVRVGLFAADTATWLTEVWDELGRGPRIGEAPEPADPPWDADGLVDLHRGSPGSRMHWRARGASGGRPCVLLHASPGSARCLEVHFTDSIGPMFACDLPGHGESDPLPDGKVETMLDALESGLDDLGIAEADLSGLEAGAWMAERLAARRPHAWRAARAATTHAHAPPRHLGARPDGGHLAAAWLAARDAAILGSWWLRDAGTRHAFIEPLDAQAIQRQAVERLIESPQAARFRRELVAVIAAARAPSAELPTAPRTPRRSAARDDRRSADRSASARPAVRRRRASRGR